MAETEFRLPRAGFEQVKRILKAYLAASRSSKEGVSLDDVARRAAINRTIVSANNAFLASLGLVEGGNKKRLTELGTQAVLTLDHPDSPDIQGDRRSTPFTQPAREQRTAVIRPANRDQADISLPKEALRCWRDDRLASLPIRLDLPDLVSAPCVVPTSVSVLRRRGQARDQLREGDRLRSPHGVARVAGVSDPLAVAAVSGGNEEVDLFRVE
jgi:hypothetical protein